MIFSQNLVNKVSKAKEDLTYTKVRVISYHTRSESFDIVDPLACRCQDIGYRLSRHRKRIADMIFELNFPMSDEMSKINSSIGAMNHMAKEIHKIGEEIQKRRVR